MPRLWHIAAWPMVVKVPVLVAGLMVTAAVTTSELVLWRLAQEQEKNLALLTNTFLDGLSASIMPGLVGRTRVSFLMPLIVRDKINMLVSSPALPYSNSQTE